MTDFIVGVATFNLGPTVAINSSLGLRGALGASPPTPSNFPSLKIGKIKSPRIPKLTKLTTNRNSRADVSRDVVKFQPKVTFW